MCRVCTHVTTWLHDDRQTNSALSADFQGLTVSLLELLVLSRAVYMIITSKSYSLPSHIILHTLIPPQYLGVSQQTTSQSYPRRYQTAGETRGHLA